LAVSAAFEILETTEILTSQTEQALVIVTLVENSGLPIKFMGL
jgi:hypothetical protein